MLYLSTLLSAILFQSRDNSSEPAGIFVHANTCKSIGRYPKYQHEARNLALVLQWAELPWVHTGRAEASLPAPGQQRPRSTLWRLQPSYTAQPASGSQLPDIRVKSCFYPPFKFIFIYLLSQCAFGFACLCGKENIYTGTDKAARAHTSIHNTSCSFCSQQKSCSLVHPGGRAVHAWHTQVVLAYSVITFALEIIPEKQTTVVPPHSQGTGSLQLKSLCNVPCEAK